MGGYGLGDGILPDALLQHARPGDLPGIRERTLEVQRHKQQSEYGRWSVEALERFLMQLDALDNTDPEETLQRLREQGLFRLVFEQLLDMKRVDEAVEVVAKHLTNPYDRLLALPNLVAAGRSDEAIRLANISLRDNFDDRVAHWLAEQYKASGDHNTLFELRLRGMKEKPSVLYYTTLKQAAEAVGKWTVVRSDILEQLEKKKEYGVLTQLYLVDKEWDAAWETLELFSRRSSRASLGWGFDSNLDLEVARQSQHARPQKAIPVFMKYAQQEIAGRDRNHYSQAAMYLSAIRNLYRELGDEAAWQALINGIRTEFRKLPALQDELTQAGL
jgi:hypothetical protein